MKTVAQWEDNAEIYNMTKNTRDKLKRLLSEELLSNINMWLIASEGYSVETKIKKINALLEEYNLQIKEIENG